MDNFINLAKKGYEAYEDSQSGQGQQGIIGLNPVARARVPKEDKAISKVDNKVVQDTAEASKDINRVVHRGTTTKATKAATVKATKDMIKTHRVSPINTDNPTKEATEASNTLGQYGHNQPSTGGYGSQGPDIDNDAVIRNASQHAGGSADSSMFGSAMSFLNQNQSQHTQPIDEQSVQNAHAEAYQKGNASSLDSNSLGAAAAMQVLQKFTSGGGSSGGSGNSQSQLISMAMAEATKLFDSQGGSSGGKQDAVNSAAMTVMKLLVQSKMGGAQTTGGANSGGLGQLMGMASQFMK
ncbi:beta-flanking protein [Ceratobasidium sp. AG-Ba]|nr:beta-flanking protein [Ceratobasidium sp. AG-Ba]